jgi:hypothetical protein
MDVKRAYREDEQAVKEAARASDAKEASRKGGRQ